MRNKASLLLLALVYAAFVSLGIPDSSLGVAWPAMRQQWALPIEAIGAVTLITTVCSALSGLASGWVLKRLGTGPVVLVSSVLTGGAFLGFSLVPSFAWLYVLALPLGFGAGSVDAGLNHFVAEHYSSRHMNWLHGFWGIGATLGPIIMAAAVSGRGWTSGYRAIATIQLSLAAVFLVSLPLWKRETAVPSGSAEAPLPGPRRDSVPAWATWLGPGLYLVYAAVELGTGLWAASILVESRGMSESGAGIAMSFFFGAIMAGRFLTGLVSERAGNRRMVRLGLAMAIVGVAIFGLAPLAGGMGGAGPVTSANLLSVLGLAVIGLGCAPVYPCLMHETPRRYGSAIAARVVGRQVAFAYVGGAIVPAAFGLLAAAAGTEAVSLGVGLAALLLLGLSELLNRVT